MITQGSDKVTVCTQLALSLGISCFWSPTGVPQKSLPSSVTEQRQPGLHLLMEFSQDSFMYQLLERSPFPKREMLQGINCSDLNLYRGNSSQHQMEEDGPGYWCLTGYRHQPESPFRAKSPASLGSVAPGHGNQPLLIAE